jgi:hypothetical protein
MRISVVVKGINDIPSDEIANIEPWDGALIKAIRSYQPSRDLQCGLGVEDKENRLTRKANWI